MLVLFLVLDLACSTCARSDPGPGTAMAIFCVCYGVCRFASDSLRVNDERVLGLTGAQYLCLALVPDRRLDPGSGSAACWRADIAAGDAGRAWRRRATTRTTIPAPDEVDALSGAGDHAP